MEQHEDEEEDEGNRYTAGRGNRSDDVTPQILDAPTL